MAKRHPPSRRQRQPLVMDAAEATIHQQQSVMATNADLFQERLHKLTMGGLWRVVPGTQLIHTYYADPRLPMQSIAPAQAVYFVVVERDVSPAQLRAERQMGEMVDQVFQDFDPSKIGEETAASES